MEKAKNNRDSVKKLDAVKTATKNSVVKAATKTAPKAMEKAKNNRGSLKKLDAVKTATKNNVVKAATKTAPKVEKTLPQTGEKQNNLALFGLGLLSLFGLGSLVDRKRRN